MAKPALPNGVAQEPSSGTMHRRARTRRVHSVCALSSDAPSQDAPTSKVDTVLSPSEQQRLNHRHQRKRSHTDAELSLLQRQQQQQQQASLDNDIGARLSRLGRAGSGASDDQDTVDQGSGGARRQRSNATWTRGSVRLPNVCFRSLAESIRQQQSNHTIPSTKKVISQSLW